MASTIYKQCYIFKWQKLRVCIRRFGLVFCKKNYNQQLNRIAIIKTDRLQVKTETEIEISVRFDYWFFGFGPKAQLRKKTKSI